MATINEKATRSAPEGALHRIRVYLAMIRFSHTVFALPFALSAVLLAMHDHPLTTWKLTWILVAMVAARSAAMGFNRIADARFDAANPRTADREIPAGRISPQAARGFVALSGILFLAAAGMLGRLCLLCAVPVLLLLLSYSYAKRFTWTAHLYLGFVIALAPLGAWIALAGTFNKAILLLCGGLMGTIAGFDILYACQDLGFDRKAGLHSIPVRFGPAAAFRMAALLHLAAWICFVLTGVAFNLGGFYTAAVVLIAIWMVIEHWLVRPDDLSRIHVAFFHMNSLISFTLLAGVALDALQRYMS